MPSGLDAPSIRYLVAEQQLLVAVRGSKCAKLMSDDPCRGATRVIIAYSLHWQLSNRQMRKYSNDLQYDVQTASCPWPYFPSIRRHFWDGAQRQRAGLRLSVSRSFRFKSSILRDLHGFTYRGHFWAAFVTEIYPRTGFLGRA
jgi:hypothetical protein